MYVSRIVARNLRCFEEVDVQLRHPGRDDTGLANLNLLLANNGGGKSTLLGAIALALLSPLLGSSGFVPFHLIRRCREGAQPEEAEIRIWRSDGAESVVHVRYVSGTEVIHSGLADDVTDVPFAAGYGSTRRAEPSASYDQSLRHKTHAPQYQRVASLFEEHVKLMPA